MPRHGLDRRAMLTMMAGVPIVAACREETRPPIAQSRAPASAVVKSPVISVEPLGFQWRTLDPFLFCVHHDDPYPAGNEKHGPATSLAGRRLGQDFDPRNGWRMYHGEMVPGFPQHPHRGFETVTIVRKGLVDHADSLGAAARYGEGDVQWLTAGRGIVHAEMFPLLDRSGPNPLELFQIWLNLPSTNKLAAPHFSMFWGSKIPRYVERDREGRSTTAAVIAGRLGGATPNEPPPSSWAARSSNDVAIWTLAMDANARFTVPAGPGTNRMLYFFRGNELTVGDKKVPARHSVELDASVDLVLENGASTSEVLILQGRPIAEPVVQRGPFVMNTAAEIERAISDYRSTRFGGWPWSHGDPVHGAQWERFARHADGRVERGT